MPLVQANTRLRNSSSIFNFNAGNSGKTRKRCRQPHSILRDGLETLPSRQRVGLNRSNTRSMSCRHGCETMRSEVSFEFAMCHRIFLVVPKATVRRKNSAVTFRRRGDSRALRVLQLSHLTPFSGLIEALHTTTNYNVSHRCSATSISHPFHTRMPQATP